MSTFNFKVLFKFCGCVLQKFLVENIGVQVKMRADKRFKPCCPRCAARLKVHSRRELVVADLPVADKKLVWVTMPATQYRCQNCKSFITKRPPEVHPTRDATWRLMEHVAEWTAFCPASKVAKMLGISESTVKRYEMDILENKLPAPNFDNLEVLLVDEKSVRKGHNYVTVVLNARNGELLYMSEGKKKESLSKFFNILTPSQKASIRAVGIDRGGAYKAAITEHLPHADIVYDRFHLMLNLNAAIDEVRRAEWHRAQSDGKHVIKGSKYLLVTGKENLKKEGKERLDELMKLNETLSKAYLLKEEFRAIYVTSPNRLHAIERIKSWCKTVFSSDLAPLSRFARGLLQELPAVTGFFKHHITNGLIECFNNQIARLIHRSCGINNLDYLFLKMRAQFHQLI